MASGLLMLLDDITTILDDIALLTKVAAKKTAGVLGDDLALNAQQVSGVDANRELPVVWAVAKGSLLNKAILVPAALLLSAAVPWAITPLLIAGGMYLCFEGCEKIAHKLFHSAHDTEPDNTSMAAVDDGTVDMAAIEKEKIRGAIRTDFVLSAEIIVITLGTVATSPFMTRVFVLVAIAVLMTIGVYGLVAGIVKLDDLGAKLIASNREQDSVTFRQQIGYAILAAAPYLMKTLSVVGTIAMFLVGGGILVHGVPAIHHAIESVTDPITQWKGIGSILASVVQMCLESLIGLVGGAVVLAVVTGIKRIRG